MTVTQKSTGTGLDWSMQDTNLHKVLHQSHLQIWILLGRPDLCLKMLECLNGKQILHLLEDFQVLICHAHLDRCLHRVNWRQGLTFWPSSSAPSIPFVLGSCETNNPAWS